MLYGWSELDTVHEMNTTMASFLFEFDAIPTWCHTSKWNHVLSIWLQTCNKLPGSVGAFTMCWVWVERRKNSDPSSISNTIYSKPSCCQLVFTVTVACNTQLWFQRSSILRFFNFRWIGWQKCHLCWYSHQPIASLLARVGGLPG